MGHFKPYPEQLFITGHQLFFLSNFRTVEVKLILYEKNHILAAKL